MAVESNKTDYRTWKPVLPKDTAEKYVISPDCPPRSRHKNFDNIRPEEITLELAEELVKSGFPYLTKKVIPPAKEEKPPKTETPKK